MRRRQFIGVGATALTVPAISARTRQESSSDLLEVVDYAIGGDDPDEESITLQNTSGEPLELSNWRVEDDGLVPAETLSPFVFPSGFTLAPAESVTIVTGEGDDTTETLSWGVGRQVWSDDGDVVYVYDDTGTLVLEQSIAGAPTDVTPREEPADPEEEQPASERPEEEPAEPEPEDEPERERAGYLEVEIVGTNDPVAAGDQVELSAEMTNTGVQETIQTVELLVDEDRESVDSASVTVAPGATETVALSYETETVDQDVERPIYVVNDDDEDERTIEITAPREPDISTVDATVTDTEVEIDELVEVDVTLENAGGAAGTHTVQLLVDGDVIDETEVDITASETVTVTVSHAFEERGEFEIATDTVGIGTVTVTDPDIRTVADFDWSYPDCPDEEVGELEQYFVGDLGADGFHLDDGGGARDDPDGCVLRTDADEAATSSHPDHEEQSDTLEWYPSRGEAILFDHYVHREGSNMEFRFGVQADGDSYYAVRLETEVDPAILELRRVDKGSMTELAGDANVAYTDQEFHDFEIEWAEEITVVLTQDGSETTIAATDDTYDDGGIGFFKENAGIVQSYAHLWNDVEVRL